MEKVKKVSPFRLASLLRLQKDPKLALNLFLNPNPNPNHKPFRHSLLSYDLIITKLGQSKLFDELELILHKLKQDTRILPTEIIFCNIIKYYGRAKLPERAITMFEQIPSFRCRRTAKSMNSLLNALLVCKQYDRFRQVLNCGSVCPDVCTYNVLIKYSFLSNDVDGARKVFDEMPKKGVWPDVVTFGTLINGLCANSMLEEGFNLKEDMVKVFNVRPNAFIYVCLIKRLCKDDKVELAFELKEEMIENEVKLDSSVYATLISALFKVGRKGEVGLLLEEMMKNGCKCDTVTYNAMISGFCNEKDFDSSSRLLKDMEKNEVNPDVITYNVIIGGLCKDGKLKEAQDLFEDMPRRKCVPDVVTYRTLFDGFCSGSQFNEAVNILDEMIFKGYAPRTASINFLLDSLFRSDSMESLWSALNSLAKENCIDASTWEMLIANVCNEDKLHSSCKFLETFST